MDGDQFNEVMTGEATVEALEAIAEAKKQKSVEANEQRALENEKRKEAEAKRDEDIIEMPTASNGMIFDTNPEDDNTDK